MENKQWLVINDSSEIIISGSLLTPPRRHRQDTCSPFHINIYQMAFQGLVIIKKLVNTHQEILLLNEALTKKTQKEQEQEEEEEHEQNKWSRPVSRQFSCLGSKVSQASETPNHSYRAA